jgi:hypothetical protein
LTQDIAAAAAAGAGPVVPGGLPGTAASAVLSPAIAALMKSAARIESSIAEYSGTLQVMMSGSKPLLLRYVAVSFAVAI